MTIANGQKSPGVYVREIDLSQRIDTTNNTIGVIVGSSSKGPINERTLITSTQEFIKVFGIPTPRTTKMHYAALLFLEESGTLYVTRVAGKNTLTAGAYLTVDDPTSDVPILRLTNFDDGTSTPLGIENPLLNLGFESNDPAAQNTLLYVCAANPGAWNNKISVQVRPSNKASTQINEYDHDPYDFWIDVFLDYHGPRDHPIESFLVRRDNKADGFGYQMFCEDVINRKSQYIRVKNNPYCKPVTVLTTAFEFLDGGADGDLPTVYDLMKAWDLYTDTELLDINLLINAGYAYPELQLKMTELAELRMDCTAILDIPSMEQSVSDAINYRKWTLNLDSSYAAIYTPDVKITDPYNDMELFVPLSGHAAAICARTDRVSQLWFAPAGLNRGQLRVLDTRFTYNQGDRDQLDAAQINMVRIFPGRGRAMWAQNTLQVEASALSNLNVRRLLNYLEKKIASAVLYSVFETNDRLLRAFLVDMVERFLRPIQYNRGLYDFAVICDSSNNPVEYIASGDLVLDVYLDPVIPAKRIHLNAKITRTGAVFREVAMATSATGLSL